MLDTVEHISSASKRYYPMLPKPLGDFLRVTIRILEHFLLDSVNVDISFIINDFLVLHITCFKNILGISIKKNSSFSEQF